MAKQPKQRLSAKNYFSINVFVLEDLILPMRHFLSQGAKPLEYQRVKKRRGGCGCGIRTLCITMDTFDSFRVITQDVSLVLWA